LGKIRFNQRRTIGSLIFNDLQQFATGTIASTSALAMTVMAEVCSVYPHRNEALISAGVLALTREPPPASLPGIARVRDEERPGWIVGRVSQEHGILVYGGSDGSREVGKDWMIGDKVELDITHSCIVGGMFGWYFMTNDEGIVMDVYFPWKWW
jgi:D-serine deaminase-like pyridoxal phosphate-dependent protein